MSPRRRSLPCKAPACRGALSKALFALRVRTKEDDQLREMIALSKERDRQQELMQSGASQKEAAATAAAEAEVRNLCLLANWPPPALC